MLVQGCNGFKRKKQFHNMHYGPDLGFQGVGQGVDLINVMDSREGNNFIVCGQTYGPDIGFQGVGQGVDPMDAIGNFEQNDQFDVRVVPTLPSVWALGPPFQLYIGLVGFVATVSWCHNPMHLDRHMAITHGTTNDADCL